MDVMTITISLPLRGTAQDYQEALITALCAARLRGDTAASDAIGGLIATIFAPSPTWPWNHPQAPSRTAGGTWDDGIALDPAGRARC